MDVNWKYIAIALAVVIVISWMHCYNRIAKLEHTIVHMQQETQDDKH